VRVGEGQRYLRAKTERMVMKIEAWVRNLQGWAMHVKITRIMHALLLDK
jgi:hypothetical protein